MGGHQVARIQRYVERAMKKGISVQIDGIDYEELSKDEWEIVFENKPYMIEYEGDERGRITAININVIDCF